MEKKIKKKCDYRMKPWLEERNQQNQLYICQ